MARARSSDRSTAFAASRARTTLLTPHSIARRFGRGGTPDATAEEPGDGSSPAGVLRLAQQQRLNGWAFRRPAAHLLANTVEIDGAGLVDQHARDGADDHD
jgi:hypothetical protein